MTNPQGSVQTATAGRVAQVATPAVTKGEKPVKVSQMNRNEMTIVVAGVVLVGLVIGTYWGYSRHGETGNAQPPSSRVESAPAGTTALTAVSIPAATVSIGPPVITPTIPQALHADIYFDFDRSRLRADAVVTLQEKAELMKKEGSWGVLIQGYTDQHGPAGYNKVLAQRRGEAVKQFLVELGVPASSIKVVTLGKEATLCDDQSKECQRLNRRVHLEMVKVATPLAALPSPQKVAQQKEAIPIIAAPGHHETVATEELDPPDAMDHESETSESDEITEPTAATPQ